MKNGITQKDVLNMILDWMRENLAAEPEVVQEEPLTLLVGDQHINFAAVFEAICRICAVESGDPKANIDKLLKTWFLEGPAVANFSWEDAESRIMPGVRHASIFQQCNRENIAHIPFVNDTVIVFLIDMPNSMITLAMKQLTGWGKEIEEVCQRAISNLENKPAPIQDVGGKVFIINCDDSYDSSRILMPDLYKRLVPELGTEFTIAIPARDCFLAYPTDFNQKMQDYVLRVHKEYPYPISPDLFLATRDGICGTIQESEPNVIADNYSAYETARLREFWRHRNRGTR